MRFMNEFDIDQALLRHKSHPILGPASQTLSNFKDLIDIVSDGWCYWVPPVRAARKLMDLVEGVEPPTEEAFKKALIPIKSFCTKRKFAFEISPI